MRPGVLTALFIVAGCCISAQKPENVATTPASAAAATITIEPIAKPAGGGSDVWIKVTIENHSDRFLVRKYAEAWSSIGFDVKDSEGVAPAETELGCRRHRSKGCDYDFYGQALIIVNPFGKWSVDYDISNEYKLNDSPTTRAVRDFLDDTGYSARSTKTYFVSAFVNDFVLVDAPRDLISAGESARFMAFVDYQASYKFQQVAPVHSNVIKVQVNF